ncbi:MAG: hypothetical protein A2V66_11145 [Ignavibacteria bacterium RBG_13_36_8]|nr:MAG: hypothetical protein A2V66_11145 [Ignavibacteria bacterium RBG_13_36_8]
MPLKKPTALPKIPKTRKKKAQSALKAIPQKKPDKIEYYCKALFKYDEKKDLQFCVFAIETVAEFISFVYEVSVDVVKEKKEIFIVLMGLRAMPNLAPKVQPARTEINFEDLLGEYRVNVVKQDGSINSAIYKFNIYKKEILLLDEFKPKKKNNRLFCKFLVADEEFSFSPKLY